MCIVARISGLQSKGPRFESDRGLCGCSEEKANSIKLVSYTHFVQALLRLVPPIIRGNIIQHYELDHKVEESKHAG